MSSDSSARSLRRLHGLASILLVVAALYFARAVLIPVVLAILLTFLLSPLMMMLQRRGVPRLPAATIVLLVAVFLFSSVGLIVMHQMRSLMQDLPQHKEAILAKVEQFQESTRNSWFSEFTATVEEINQRLRRAEEDDRSAESTGAIRFVPSSLSMLQVAVVPVTDTLLMAGVALVLTFYVLLRREDMRNRLIRLWGNRNLIKATKAFDEAGQRIGSFLITQLVVNTVFGVVMGLGLALLGVPYPLLGGFLGGLMRYVPFVGVWIAAAGPVLLSLAILPGLGKVLLVLLLVLALEVLFANFVEPFTYGHSIGVSEVSLLIALAFWGWLWGIVGLILALPMTACLAVLGRHIPRLRWLAIVLGDGPALEPHQAFYQRLLARDEEEVDQLASEFVSQRPGLAIHEELLLPALVLNRTHRERGEFTPEDEKAVHEQIRILLENQGGPLELGTTEDRNGRTSQLSPPGEEVLVLGCPVADEANEVALEMFARILPRGRLRLDISSPSLLASELVIRVHDDDPGILLLVALPPDSFAQVRYLVKRLRAEFPDKKLLVACWGLRRNLPRVRERLLEAGADMVSTRLEETRAQLTALLPTVGQSPVRAAK